MGKDDPPKKLSKIFMITGVIFGIIVLSIIFQTIQSWRIIHTWPQATGVVSKTSPKGWWNEEKQQRYYLEYQYKAGGKEYTNVQFHIKERSIKKFTYLIRNFKKGDPINVWYNPKSPKQAVINTEYLRNAFALLVVFTGFLIMLGTMILKEKLWQRQTQNLIIALPDDYKGIQQLQSSKILSDREGVVRLNTGMSIFWNFGIPFLFFSFLSIFVMLSFLNEINPGWSLSDYLSVMAISWGVSLIGGFFVKIGFRNTLEIDANQKEIKEISVTLFKKTTKVYAFSDIQELKLYKEKWLITTTLKNWILYLHTRSRQSLFISFRNRDIQPADENYLGIVRQRLEHLIFGEQR